MRSTDSLPAPRCILAFMPSAITLTPVFALIFATVWSGASLNASVPSRISVLLSPPINFAAFSITTSSTCSGAEIFGSMPTTPSPFQAVSAGKIKVATCPGGALAAAIASAPSGPTVLDVVVALTQAETGLANPTMSEVRGA